MRRARARFGAIALTFAFAGLMPRTARAQDLSVAPSQAPEGTPPADSASQVPYWSAGEARPFFGMVVDFAGLSTRVEADIGYGKPHNTWVGLEVASALSLRGPTTTGGVRASWPWGNARVLARNFHGIRQRLIAVDAVIDDIELDVSTGPASAYGAIDGEVSFEIPLPVGTLGVVGSAHGIFVPNGEGWLVFEEATGVIMAPPFVWRGRLSYLVALGDPATLRVGGIVEVIHNPGREAVTLRTGPAASVSLTHHLEAIGVAAFSFLGPDEIGLAGADLGQISLRYRWATGDLWPDFP